MGSRSSADNFASNASFEGHYPFGESWYETGMAYPSITKKFTTYNKDTEASSAFLNYAVHRQHSARLGRFHMADPVHGATNNPQSLNRFSYTLGDPINHTDPTGLLGVKIMTPVDPGPCDEFDEICGPATGFGSGCDPLGFGFLPVPTGGPGDPACTTGDPGGGGPGPGPDCSNVQNAVTFETFNEIVDCSHAVKTIHKATAQVIGFTEGVKIGSVSTSSDNNIQLVGKAISNEFNPLIYYQNYRTNLGGTISWVVQWTCKGKSQPPMEGTTSVECKGGR